MKTLKDMKVGDTVIVRSHFRSAQVKVVRVGRINLYVEKEKWPFDIETGYSKDSHGRYHLLTLDEDAHLTSVSDAERRLQNFGIRLDHGFAAMTKEKILAIDEALRSLMDAANVGKK